MSIALTVVAGYLGAGKTTLVNRMLSQVGDQRFAIVVNDFGEVQVDELLITARSEEVIALANGCVCCSAVDGMAAAINRVLSFRPEHDHLIIEASGVSDPVEVARWASRPGLFRNGIVVCVDATSIGAKARDRWVGDLVQRQIMAADLVALSRADRVDRERRADLERWLSTLAPGVPIVAGDSVAVLEAITGLGLSRPRDASASVELAGAALPPGGGAPHGHRKSVARSDAVVDLQRLSARIIGAPPGVVRIKGMVAAADCPHRWTIVNAVDQDLSVSAGPPRTHARDCSVLVVLSTDEISAADLNQFLGGLLAD